MPASGASLRQRQVHLDFHTPGSIPDIGAGFDPGAFAAAVTAAHVDSMTVFSRCHHGYCYHPTDVGTMHPGLGFDLMGAQIAALHGAGVRAPIYITVGWDELMADEHPEWLQIDSQGRICRKQPGDMTSWRFLDFASPYIDYVYAQTTEVLERYGPVDGIFFDILRQDPDGNHSVWRRRRMAAEGIDPEDAAAVAALATRIERETLERLSTLVRERTPEATIFFNSRLRPDRDPEQGSRAELAWYSHVEVESLPTGTWGYNHYPLFAAYFQTLGSPLLGMTGIFHGHWGDFGSGKPEPALAYECARMLASGAACSVGDHLHPRGVLDPAAYATIGTVFAKVEALEPWCLGAEPVAEIGVLMAETGPRFGTVGRDVDEGVLRMLLELHRPFGFLDRAADLAPYTVLIAPDITPFDAEYAAKIRAYVDGGGALLLTHRAGLTPEGDRFALADLMGVEFGGEAPETPDYLVAGEGLGARFAGSHQVLYERGSALRLAGADALAWVGLPYFSRTPQHFMGHRQAAFDRVSDLPAVAQRGRVITCHSPLFGAYREHAVPAYRDLVGLLLDQLAPERLVEAPGLPTTAEVSVLRQPGEGGRTILHLIHAVPQRRGVDIDIVEDVLPLANVRVGVRCGGAVGSVVLAPSGEELGFETEEGVTWVSVPRVEGHQVVVFGSTRSLRRRPRDGR